MQGKIVLAVQDSYIQRFPARFFQAQKKTDIQLPYFNSGVMVIDLKGWRAEGLEQRCLEAAERLKHRTKWLDQDVLNICLAGRWGLLPPFWNKQFSLGLFPDWQCSPYEEVEFQEARSHPAIIHFCTRTKPWHCFSDHPREVVLAYQAALRQAPFGARLPPRSSPLQRIAEFFAAPHRSLLDTIAAALRARRRKHAIQAMLPDMLKLAVLHPWTLVTVPVSVVRERAAMRLGKVSR
jgi:lipopolysaccharide biosynthesis glycosyltransferase